MMTPLEIIHADAEIRLKDNGWGPLWTAPMVSRVADALSYVFGYAMGEHLWEIDLLSCGGLPYDFSKGNLDRGNYLLVAEVREDGHEYTGRRVAGLKIVFRRNLLLPKTWERVGVVNNLLRRSVVQVPYWTWREARPEKAKPLGPKQTLIPGV